MAITRSQYVTVEELNTILGTSYSDDSTTALLIYEASELIKSHCYDWVKISEDDYTTVTAPNNLKLATAYQVQFNSENEGNDFEYAGASKSVSIGKTSEKTSFGSSGSQEFRKIAPKTQRYLIQSGLLNRIL